MTTLYTPPVQGTGVKATVQRIGGYLAAMLGPVGAPGASPEEVAS
jgi:PTS system mannitol-specific IIC component